MKTEIYEMVKLTADEGKILTNGNIYGRTIALGRGDSVENYREITEAEYAVVLKELESEGQELE